MFKWVFSSRLRFFRLRIRTCFVFLIFGISFGCDTPQERDLKSGSKLQIIGEYREAVTAFESAMKRNPRTPEALKAARESVKILVYELKNYERAIEVLKFLILYSTDPEERWRAQSQIAQIYFDNLTWYDKALIEFSKLLTSPISKKEQLAVRLAIARCYYHLGQFPLSWSESSQILTEYDLTQDQEFDTSLLQANIQISLKKWASAADILEGLEKKFAERARKENVGINLSICYEELGKLKEAVRVLEKMRRYYEPRDYIDLRISKIRERYLEAPKSPRKK